MFRFRFLLVLLIAFCVGPSAGYGQEAPTLEELLEVAHATQDHCERRPARWKILFELPKGDLLVEVVIKGERRRTQFYYEDHLSKSLLLDVISTDGLWYVTDGDERYKCRPFEAVFSAPSLYGFLERSDLHVYHEEMESIGTFEEMDGEVAVYRVPLTEELHTNISAAYEQLLNLAAISKEIDPEREQKLESYRDFIENGSLIRINTRTGVIEQAGALTQIFYVKSFEKLRFVSPKTFDVSNQLWEDRSGAIAGENRDWNNVILVDDNPAYIPGQGGGSAEPFMLNLATGEKRRVPFAHGWLESACFSPDRSRCYVTGWLPTYGCLGIMEVDLETQDQFRLGSAPLQTGINLGATVSPDESLVAVLQLEIEAGPLQFRLHLIDVESGESMKVGDTHDLSHLNWLPNSDGLILVMKEHQWQPEKTTPFICHMDLDGNLTKLCQGNQAKLLSRSNRILFRGDERAWYTCDMEGKDQRKVGDGLAEYAFPTMSMDGSRLYMMKRNSEREPVPHIIDIETGVAYPLEIGLDLPAILK